MVHKSEDRILVLCGFSGAGKDSIANIFKKNGYNFIMSTTSRPMREGESQDNPYNFVNDSEFRKLIENNELIEYRTYHTEFGDWFYGITKGTIKNGEKYVVVLDIHGLKEIKKIYGDRVKSFFITVSDDIRENRAKLRGGFDQKEWNRRLKDDRNIFSENEIFDNVDHVVENYNLDECYCEIMKKLVDIHCDEII